LFDIVTDWQNKSIHDFFSGRNAFTESRWESILLGHESRVGIVQHTRPRVAASLIIFFHNDVVVIVP